MKKHLINHFRIKFSRFQVWKYSFDLCETLVFLYNFFVCKIKDVNFILDIMRFRCYSNPFGKIKQLKLMFYWKNKYKKKKNEPTKCYVNDKNYKLSKTQIFISTGREISTSFFWAVGLSRIWLVGWCDFTVHVCIFVGWVLFVVFFCLLNPKFIYLH